MFSVMVLDVLMPTRTWFFLYLVRRYQVDSGMDSLISGLIDAARRNSSTMNLIRCNVV